MANATRLMHLAGAKPPADGQETEEVYIDNLSQTGTPGPAGAKGADGKSVKSIGLTTDTSGKVTGGTVTFSDSSTAPITVTTANTA